MCSRDEIVEQRKVIALEFPQQGHDYTFLRRTVLGRIGAAANYDEQFVDKAMEVFDEVRNDVVVFPEVRPALEALCNDYKLIAVTNGNSNLQVIGIDDLFHDVVSASAAGVARTCSRGFAAETREQSPCAVR